MNGRFYLREIGSHLGQYESEMAALPSSETSVDVYQSTWCNIPEDLIVYQYHCENLTSCRMRDSCVLHDMVMKSWH